MPDAKGDSTTQAPLAKVKHTKHTTLCTVYLEQHALSVLLVFLLLVRAGGRLVLLLLLAGAGLGLAGRGLVSVVGTAER